MFNSAFIDELQKIAGLTAGETVAAAIPGLNSIIYPALVTRKVEGKKKKLKTFLINSALAGGGGIAGVLAMDKLTNKLTSSPRLRNRIIGEAIMFGAGAGLGIGGAALGKKLTHVK